MRRLLIISFVLLMLMSMSSFATNTRVLTMGDNNNVLLDDANIWLYPSRMFEYPNLAIGEFANNSFTDFGVHWKFGSDNPWVLGTYFTTLPAVNPDDLNGMNLVPFDYSLLNNKRIDLFYGNALGDYNLGLRISLLSSSQDWDMSGNQETESFAYYDFDLGLTPTDGKWDVAINFAIGKWTDEDATGATETEADGYYDFSLMGRYFMEQGPNYTYIPHVGIISSKHGIKNYVLNGDPADLDQTDKYTLTGFEAGFGLNYTPAANVLAVADFGFMFGKWKDETEVPPSTTTEESETGTVLPYFKIGLDADVFKWMDIRLGATSYWTSEKDEDNNVTPPFKLTSSWTQNNTYLGFGFHWNRLHVDTYTDPQIFLQGFDFISGNGNADMNFRISAVYEMM